jgi:N-acetylgalactosamine-6-sulfatase
MFLLNFLLAASTVVPNNQERPNIIVFLVDDMGLMDTSVPFLTDEKGSPVRHPLNEWYRTPNMERLANQGIRFSTFYAQSLSSPSRASILTGKNAARHRTTNWINAESNNRDKYGPFEWNWVGLTRDDCVYPLLLQKEGYRTIHVGKAHFGSKGSEGENPVNLGFDVNIAGSSIGHPGSYYGENGYGWIKGQRYRAVPDLEQYHGTNTFLSDALTLEAIKEIEKAVSKKQPFYLNLAHYAVHAPFEMDHRFSGNYNSPEKERHKYAKAFATLVEGMDKSLGDLMDKLEQLGIAQNTLIIFLGDNGSDAPLGGPDAYASSAPLRGQKGSEYEGGVRVPFIVGWAHPDKDNPFQKAYPVAQGSIQTQQGTIMDIYPTVLSVAGVRMPANYITDGSDLKKLISGKKDPKHRNDFLMHYPHSSRGKYFTTYRKGNWKLIYYYRPERPNSPSYKLFNLSEDPCEKKDLSTSNPSQVSKMFKAMRKRLEEENALYPVDEQGCTITPRLIK